MVRAVSSEVPVASSSKPSAMLAGSKLVSTSSQPLRSLTVWITAAYMSASPLNGTDVDAHSQHARKKRSDQGPTSWPVVLWRVSAPRGPMVTQGSCEVRNAPVDLLV